MIQERLGFLWKRILLYKYLMVLTLAFNVFASLSGAVCSYLLWTGAFDLSQEVQQESVRVAKLQSLQSKIRELPTLDPLKKSTQREALLSIQAWERLRLEAEEARLDNLPAAPGSYLVDKEASYAWVNSLEKSIDSTQKNIEDRRLLLAKRESRLSSAVIWLGSLTIIFGVALPLVILTLLAKLLRRTQVAMTEAAKNLVHSWSEAMDRHGQDPFKNPQFWVEILLLAGEQMAYHSRHPAVAFGSELSFLVRQELHRARDQKDKAA